MVDAGWQIARTLPSENRQRRRTLGIADMCGAGFRRIRPSGSTCGVVVRKKEDRVPLDRFFAEYRCEELVAETLVVPFCVIVHYVFGYRCAQVSLTERYEAVETLSTYGENEPFRICVQIRTISGKAKGLHA